MRLSIGIQHHPSRAESVRPLLAQLPAAELVPDPDPHGVPSPWRTYRVALERTPPDATHRLVLQDDVELCRSFLPAVVQAVAAQPDRLLCLHVSGNPPEHSAAVYRAAVLGLPWAELDNLRWTPVVATLWPAPYIRPFLDFVDAKGWGPEFRADDEVVGQWLLHAGLRPLACVPSLVQHPDLVDSLLGWRAQGGHNPGRTAACFAGPECDPATMIDWSLPPNPAVPLYV